MQRGVTADLQTSNVSSIAQLQHEHGPFNGTVVAAGAAAGVLPEIGAAHQLLLTGLASLFVAHQPLNLVDFFCTAVYSKAHWLSS